MKTIHVKEVVQRPEIITRTQGMVWKDRRLTARDLVKALGISLGSMNDILA